MVLSLLQTLTCALIASNLEPFPWSPFPPVSFSHGPPCPGAGPTRSSRGERLRPRSNTHPPREGPRRHVAMVLQAGLPWAQPALPGPAPSAPQWGGASSGAHSFIWRAADQKTLFLNSKNKAKRPENNCSDFLALMKCLHFDTDRLFNYMRDFFSLALLPH